MRLGAVKYIPPFFFVYAPALLTHGTGREILPTVFAVIGIWILASALEGYLSVWEDEELVGAFRSVCGRGFNGFS